MQQSKFTVGDKVVLRGSPQVMVVVGFSTTINVEAGGGLELRVTCSWVDSYGRPRQEGYPEAALEPVPEEPSRPKGTYIGGVRKGEHTLPGRRRVR